MGSEYNGILECVKREIEESSHLKITMSGLSKKHKITRKVLLYEFIEKYGISPLDYHNKLKFELFKKLLIEKNGNLYRTSYDLAKSLGFKSDSGLQYFLKKMSSENFRDHLNNAMEENRRSA